MWAGIVLYGSLGRLLVSKPLANFLEVLFCPFIVEPNILSLLLNRGLRLILNTPPIQEPEILSDLGGVFHKANIHR